MNLLVFFSSLPIAFILGKQKVDVVMEFLYAVWIGRNEQDCDAAYPECHADARRQATDQQSPAARRPAAAESVAVDQDA
jgi:hypothetical protein